MAPPRHLLYTAISLVAFIFLGFSSSPAIGGEIASLHRAFCDALAEESARAQTGGNLNHSEEDLQSLAQVSISSSLAPPSPSQSPVTTTNDDTTSGGSGVVLTIQNQGFVFMIQVGSSTTELPENSTGILHQFPQSTCVNGSSNNTSCTTSSGNTSMFANLFTSSSMGGASLHTQNSQFSDLITLSNCPTIPELTEPTSLYLSNNGSNLFEWKIDDNSPTTATHNVCHCFSEATQMVAVDLSQSVPIKIIGGSTTNFSSTKTCIRSYNFN